MIIYHIHQVRIFVYQSGDDVRVTFPASFIQSSGPRFALASQFIWVHPWCNESHSFEAPISRSVPKRRSVVNKVAYHVFTKRLWEFVLSQCTKITFLGSFNDFSMQFMVDVFLIYVEKGGDKKSVSQDLSVWRKIWDSTVTSPNTSWILTLWQTSFFHL